MLVVFRSSIVRIAPPDGYCWRGSHRDEICHILPKLHRCVSTSEAHACTMSRLCQLLLTSKHINIVQRLLPGWKAIGCMLKVVFLLWLSTRSCAHRPTCSMQLSCSLVLQCVLAPCSIMSDTHTCLGEASSCITDMHFNTKNMQSGALARRWRLGSRFFCILPDYSLDLLQARSCTIRLI